MWGLTSRSRCNPVGSSPLSQIPMTLTKHQDRQFALFQLHGGGDRTVATTAEIDTALKAKCAVAVGVSGGKDSATAALRVIDYLDAVGHQGPRILIHSHLGPGGVAAITAGL